MLVPAVMLVMLSSESWTNSLVSHHGMARMQPSMSQFLLMPAECPGELGATSFPCAVSSTTIMRGP